MGPGINQGHDGLDFFGKPLIDGGKTGAHDAGDGKVVVADDGDVFGNTNAALLKAVDEAGGDDVGGGNDALDFCGDHGLGGVEATVIGCGDGMVGEGIDFGHGASGSGTVVTEGYDIF